MPLRALVSVFDIDGSHVQALVQSMPRSFKMHVWAAPLAVNNEATTVLEYIGNIQPIDQTDLGELEMLVRELYVSTRRSKTRSS